MPVTCQPVDQLAHDLLVGVPVEQARCQHVVDDHTGRQLTGTLLDLPCFPEHVINQVAMKDASRHANADAISESTTTSLAMLRT